MVQASSVTIPNLVGLTLCTFPPGEVGAKMSTFLYVPYVTLLNGRDYAKHFDIKALEYRNDFDILDRERFVVLHSPSNFSSYCKVASPQNVEGENIVKFADFFAYKE